MNALMNRPVLATSSPLPDPKSGRPHKRAIRTTARPRKTHKPEVMTKEHMYDKDPQGVRMNKTVPSMAKAMSQYNTHTLEAMKPSLTLVRFQTLAPTGRTGAGATAHTRAAPNSTESFANHCRRATKVYSPTHRALGTAPQAMPTTCNICLAPGLAPSPQTRKRHGPYKGIITMPERPTVAGTPEPYTVTKTCAVPATNTRHESGNTPSLSSSKYLAELSAKTEAKQDCNNQKYAK
mmetsp:Transcript_12107/g.34682  ORF Transcript_12107/g.34682 Transcript_12107/m.34682 type:complete len:236 (+) Transcript_12107:848-1555(+)